MSENNSNVKNEKVEAAENTTETKNTMKATDEVLAKLTKYGADEATVNKIVNDLGVETMEDLAALEAKDLVDAGMKIAKARNMLTSLNETVKPTVTNTAAVAETRAIQTQYSELLPTIPSDDSWLNALKTGGVLKVDESSYIAAIRAALADRAGLYSVPETLSKAMEKYADETEEQVDTTFYALRKSLTRRTYGDIFAAIDGLDGNFITESRRKDFLNRIRDNLWPAIAESYSTLDSWYTTWKASFSDPSMWMAAISGGIGGLGGAVGGMITLPDTAAIHDAGDTLVNAINRVFRGTGVQVAAALAYDANVIRNTLEDTRLPSMVGAKNREMMLKKIGANVSSNYIRLEKNLVKYVLAFTKHDTVTSDIEVNYFIALWQLGAQINWNELNGVNPTNSVMRSITGKQML